MRCLWLTWIDPSPEHDGQRIYSGRLIHAMASTGARIEVLCASSAGSHRRDGDLDDGAVWHLAPHTPPPPWRSIGSRLPHLAYRAASPVLRRRLADLLNQPHWDCIVFDGLAAGWAIDAVTVRRTRARGRPALIYVSHNHEASTRTNIALAADSRSPRAILQRRDARKAAELERRLIASVDLITAITPEDAGQFQAQVAGTPILVLTPGYQGRRLPERRIGPEVPRRAVVVGSFDWNAKQTNLREFLDAADPLFAAAGAEIEVVGNGDPEFLDAMRAGTKATRLVGGVPSVTPFLDNARIAIVAERLGGGFKLKILDYVFNRLPIAALHGSTAGAPLAANTSMLCFDDHAPLAKGVLAAIDDLDLLNRLQRAAYDNCIDRFDWSDRGKTLTRSIAAL